MKPKSLTALLTALFIAAAILSSCAPAATPAVIAKEAKPQSSSPIPQAAPLSERPQPTAALLIPAKPAPRDNYFQDYGMNPYMDTVEDHLSTFALDVDTAAYTVARRYVMDGNLPPADAVRVEEFVNYFDQDYANPPDVAFGIYADGAPSPFEPGATLLRIGIQGYQVSEEDANQPP